MSRPIPDFTDIEKKLIAQTLAERYGRPVPPEFAEVELQLDPTREDATPCPAAYWNERGVEFIVCKVGDSRFRCEFLYSPTEQFSTGREVYDSLGDCLVTLLQVQAEHATTRASALRNVAGTIGEGDGDDEYFGPLVV